MHAYRQLCVYVLAPDAVNNGPKIPVTVKKPATTTEPAPAPAPVEPAAKRDLKKFVHDELGLKDETKELTDPDKLAKAKELSSEFAAYDADASGDLSEAEFQKLLHDRKTADIKGDEISARGDDVKARQEELNKWIEKDPAGQAWAKTEEGQKALAPDGKLKLDGKEGPRTRAVEQAMRKAKMDAAGATKQSPEQEKAAQAENDKLKKEADRAAAAIEELNKNWDLTNQQKAEAIAKELEHIPKDAAFKAMRERAEQVLADYVAKAKG